MSAKVIAAVHYYAYYDGFDENGDGQALDWHGLTKERLPSGHLGSTSQWPYRLTWDTSMLVAQSGLQLRAVVEFQPEEATRAEEERRQAAGERFWKAKGWYWQSSPRTGLTISHPPGIEVMRLPPQQMSIPFWSRADRLRSCRFSCPVDPETLERVQLHLALWDGGSGSRQDYFQWNGRPLAIAGQAKHDVLLRVVDLEKEWIQPENNEVALRSDTSHHGLEILYPGPQLVLRYRKP